MKPLQIDIEIDVLFYMGTTIHLNQECIPANQRLDCLEKNLILLIHRTSETLTKAVNWLFAAFVHH